jgi:protein-tyrosine phosphatase
MSSREPIKLAGALNFRDLGNLPTTDGHVTRTGKMFRSDSLDYLTAEDVHVLTRTIGLTTVIDLRAPVEYPTGGPAWAPSTDVEFVCLPLGNDIFDDKVTREDRDRQTLQARRYLAYIEAWSDNVVAALRRFARSTHEGPCLVHCAQGKDRTGVIVALLLSLLNVRRESIVADYVESARHVDAITARHQELPFYRARASVNPPELYRADPHTIEYFLDAVEERFGGAASWCRQHGLADVEMESLRADLRVSLRATTIATADSGSCAAETR